MEESEAIKTVVMQVAIQAALAAVIVLRDAGARPTSGINIGSSGEAHSHRFGRPALRQP